MNRLGVETDGDTGWTFVAGSPRMPQSLPSENPPRLGPLNGCRNASRPDRTLPHVKVDRFHGRVGVDIFSRASGRSRFSYRHR